MKEIKIAGLIIAIVALVYYGVEPYAQRVMHPQSTIIDYSFSDLDTVNTELKGSAQRGKKLVVENCGSCHSISSAGHVASMTSSAAEMAWGVVPPDLSLSGRLYDAHYLANFIAAPVSARQLSKHYSAASGKAFPMPPFSFLGAQAIMDIVAYLQTIAPELDMHAAKSSKTVFVAACGRCHSLRYAGIESTSPPDILAKHLGAVPPDLSMYFLSRGQDNLRALINNPQQELPGTAMPRIGLTVAAEDTVLAYMQSVSDSKKSEREELGPWVLSYLFVLVFFAWLWKRHIWKAVT